MNVKSKPIDRLMEAMDRCAIARGEAMWTNGYRTGVPEGPRQTGLYEKEKRQFLEVDRQEKSFRRLALRLLREAAK